MRFGIFFEGKWQESGLSLAKPLVTPVCALERHYSRYKVSLLTVLWHSANTYCDSTQPMWGERSLWCIASENSVFCRKYVFLLQSIYFWGALFFFRHLWRLRTSSQCPSSSSVLSEDCSKNEWLSSTIILSTVATSRKEKGMWGMSL